MTSPESQTNQPESVAHWVAGLPGAVIDLREGLLGKYTYGTVTVATDGETPARAIRSGRMTFTDQTATAIIGDHPETREQVVISVNPDSGKQTHITVIPPR